MEKTIYKKDSKGKIRYLTISTEAHILVQESGVIGTNSPIFSRSHCEPKNIGKSNATTSSEQAVLEAESKIKEKLRMGYFNTMAEAQGLGGKDFLLPMLAKDYKKEFAKVVYPCYVQPKLDGMRALGSNEKEFMSRTGKTIDTIKHINLPSGDYIFDGELYAHGISFQENMKLIKKYRKYETEEVKYHIYDLVMDAPFSERHRLLTALVDSEIYPNIFLVPTFIVNSQEEMLTLHSQFISEGYEGTMIRHSEESYQVNKRSSQLLKYKDFIDETFVVVVIITCEARQDQGVVVCAKKMETAGDNVWVQTFNCGMKFSHFDRKVMLARKEIYIGQTAEVRFFEYTDGGLPRFPVCVGFREDK